MATIAITSAPVRGGYGAVEGSMATWALLTTTNDIGAAFQSAVWSDRSVQVTGTFGAGGNVKILGSNDGTNYAILTDPQGNALDITAAKIEQITEVTQFIKPQVTAGDGTTSVTVTILAVRKY